MECDELVMEGTIESFHEGVHLGTPGIGVVVNDAELGTRITKQEFELTSVVGLYFGHWYRRHLPEESKEMRCCLGRMRPIPVGKGDAMLHIDRGEYVGFDAIDESYDRIDLKPALFSASKLDILRAAQFLDRLLADESTLLAVLNAVANVGGAMVESLCLEKWGHHVFAHAAVCRAK